MPYVVLKGDFRWWYRWIVNEFGTAGMEVKELYFKKNQSTRFKLGRKKIKGKNGRIMIMKKVKIIIYTLCFVLVALTTFQHKVLAEYRSDSARIKIILSHNEENTQDTPHTTQSTIIVGNKPFRTVGMLTPDYITEPITSLGTSTPWSQTLDGVETVDGRIVNGVTLRHTITHYGTYHTANHRSYRFYWNIDLEQVEGQHVDIQRRTITIDYSWVRTGGRWVITGTERTILDGGEYAVNLETFYAPKINEKYPLQPMSSTPRYTTFVDLGTTLNINQILSETTPFDYLFNIDTVHSGATNQLLNWVDKTGTELPPPGHYHLESISGEPMNNAGLITGIGKTTWLQRVTDFDGDSTEFERDVTIQTDKKPNINLVYDDGDLAGTPFTDGTANGGIDGWSNVPLRAVVHSKNDDDSYVVDGYYFNQINDDQGGIAHGDNQKEPASRVYATETVGTNVTGVMVDDAKTTELSVTTDPVSMKIDRTNPVAAASYDSDTDTLINQSEDDLSGLQMTKVAIVSPGDPAPAETAYRDFSEWQSLVNGNRQYDIYVIATDKAGNTATTTLTNQFLRGGTTNLEISKTVVGKYGAYHKPFEVTVVLEDDQGMAVNGAYTVSSSLVDVADYTLTFVNGAGVVYLKHGETISIQGIPVGYKYTVKETDEAITVGDSVYSVTYNGAPSATGVTAVLDGSAAQVEIKNIRETIPDTGIEENRGTLLLGSTLILLVFLIALNRYCDKKRRYQL
jgi:hypothetical protein